MLTLANSQLSVELLDPEADRARLGPRYCWGGYVWQVHDAAAGPLFTGPEWPKPDPTPHNGQGLPESFRHRTRDGRLLTWNGDHGVALGAGELALNAAGKAEVVRPCIWQVTPTAGRLAFRTRQQAAGFDYELVRTIELTGRTLHSNSVLTNHGGVPLQLEWFAHPFFALTGRLIHAEIPEGTRLADNPGFALEGRTFFQKRRFNDEMDGHLDSLQLPAGEILTARLAHPALTHIGFETDFVPGECLVWGNSNTFSLEPYLTLSLVPGQTKQWNLRYDFGEIK